jgi:transposase
VSRDYFVGLDVHSQQTTFVIEDAAGGVLERGSIPTTRASLEALVERRGLKGRALVGLETGNSSFFVAEILLDLEVETQVIDAHEVRQKANRPTQKCDTRDAFEICEGIRLGIYRSIVPLPPRWARQLREILSRRRHFVTCAAREAIAVKRVLRSAGLRELARSSLRTAHSWRKLEHALAQVPTPGMLARFVKLHRCTWQAVREQVGEIEALLEEQVAQLDAPKRAAVERLDGIPGFGRLISISVLAILYDASRFESSKHVGSYAGFTPRMQQSGDRNVHGHITRKGSIELRAVLCEAAHCCRRPSHPLQPYFLKLTARRGYKLATVATAHRLLRIAWRILRDGTDFDPAKLGVEPGPFEEKRLRYWRIAKSQPAVRSAGA